MSYFQRIIKGYGGLFTGLMLSGIALIGLGMKIEQGIISAIGGAIFGTSFGHIISNLRGQDFLDEVKHILQYSLDANFTSDENKLQEYRKKFYHYHLTEISGKYVWRFAIIDFTSFAGIGKLGTIIDVKDLEGKIHKYNISGGIRDDRFIMFEKASVGNESCLVELYPSMGRAYHHHHCGILILESWDGTKLLSPCIMSHTVIENWDKEGTVDEEVGKKLDDIWSHGFSQIKIPPMIKNSL